MRIVMALGGNALLRRGEAPEAEAQRRNIQLAVEKSVAPIARRHELVVTHGNGPQVGLLALQAAAYRDVRPYPLDVLGAESEGDRCHRPSRGHPGGDRGHPGAPGVTRFQAIDLYQGSGIGPVLD